MSMILTVTNKALEGLNMVNPRQSNHGVVQSGLQWFYLPLS